jgi:hypothetical protein
MGGNVPLGYVVKDRKLVVSEPEAAIVRSIFERFVRIGSATVLAQELRAEGVRTKRGKLIDKGYLYKLLNNRTYLGLAVHKDAVYSASTRRSSRRTSGTRCTRSLPRTSAPDRRTPGRRRPRCSGG